MVSAPVVARLPTPEATSRALAALDRQLGSSKVDTSETARANHAIDESDAEGMLPDAVVYADDVADVARVLAIAEEHGVPVTPRAAGTGRTGGAVPVLGGIVLATQRMAQILEIDRHNLLAVVQPGLVTSALHEAVEAEGLFYPPDPNSLKTCMIGGNIAENAGGPRAFKYGVTREYVLGLEVCLMGGRILRTGRRTVKGVTGYDVTSLLVGSEGTLAVFTEATLRLIHKPSEVATVLALFDDVRAAAASVRRVIEAGLVPRCLELMDGPTLGAIRAQNVAVDPRANAMLLVEIDGGEDFSMSGAMERLGNALTEGGDTLDVVAAQDASQRARLWEARRMLSRATRKIAKYKLSEDIVVPRSHLVDLLTEVDRIGEATGVRHLAYGHAGDGNLHVNFLWDDESERPIVERAVEALMRATVRLRGTLSGEHGIGLTKAPYLSLEQSPELIGLQRRLKHAFDPTGLLNPGKIFSAGHTSC